MSTVNILPDGRPPDLGDIIALAPHNVIVNSCYYMFRTGELTLEQALMAMVVFLAQHNHDLQKSLVDASLRQRTVYIKEGKLETDQ